MAVKIIQTWCNFKDWTHGNLFEVISLNLIINVDTSVCLMLISMRVLVALYKSASRVFFETTLIGRRHGAGLVAPLHIYKQADQQIYMYSRKKH